MAKQKILIIDDDPANREVISEYLVDYGFEIFQAGNGDQGITVLKEQHPDIVLLDIKMPGKNGFTVLDEIKRIPLLSQTPVILLSGYYSSPNYKVKGLERGADDYISRPFDNTELLARIRVVLRRQPECPPCQREENVLEGNIEDVNLVELLQTIELGKKNADVNIPELDIQVILENGRLIYCRFREFKDYDALLRILLLDEGHFVARFHHIPKVNDKRDIKVTEAIMQITAYLDETNSLINRFKPAKYVRINKEVSRLKGAERFGLNAVVPFKHFIIALHGDLKENLILVWNMVKDKTLGLLKGR